MKKQLKILYKHREYLVKTMSKSQRNLDKYILYFSGGGIILSLILNDMFASVMEHSLLKSIICFLISIFCVLFSIKKSINLHDKKIKNLDHEIEEFPNYDAEHKESYLLWFLNFLSLYVFLMGIIGIIIFIIFMKRN